VSTVTAGTAIQCLGQVNAVAVLMLGVKGPLLAAAGGFKVGYDVGACVAKDMISRQLSADKHAALQYCLDEGGTPTGEVGNDVMCTVTVTP
jgi:fructose-1,6-bisphosphatase/sedoheptulose 1,7-bisphosphatase-like protein